MSAEKPGSPGQKPRASRGRTLSLRSRTEGLEAKSGLVRGRGKSVVPVEVKRRRSSLGVAESLADRINLGKSLSAKKVPRPGITPPKSDTKAALESEREVQRQKAMRAREMLEQLKTQKSRDTVLAEGLEEVRNQREEQARLKKQVRDEVELGALESAQKGMLEAAKAVKKVTPAAPEPSAGNEAPPRVRETREEKESSNKAVREKKPKSGRGESSRRRQGKLTISQALSADGEPFDRGRSVAALRRQRDKERARARQQRDRNEMVVREVVLPETINVGDLANRMAVRGAELIKHLFKNGMVMKLTDILDADTAELVVQEFGHNVRRITESAVEDQLLNSVDEHIPPVLRPPVVTVMGHVDHGKTTLLDTLRKTRVAAGEAGGITQHIAAYQVTVKGDQKVTFLDTPGHAAFSAMRSRGAKVTDIIVLVVAADDGVLPQTVEAINHARAAEVPLIVAINKCDLPAADSNRVREELLHHEIIGEANGGDTLMVDISALNGDGLDQLLEAILLQAELLELTAVAEGRARGIVLEARQEKGRGVVASVLVQAGQLQKGDIFVAGHEWGRVKMQYDDQGKVLTSAGSSTPVEIQGFQGVVKAGDELIVVGEETMARDVTEYRRRKMNEIRLASLSRNSVDQMFQNIASQQISKLNVVLRTDVLGSQEAIVQALQKISTEEVTVKVVHSGIGAITETDVTLAESSNALLIGFNVRANAPARDMARQGGLAIRYFAIIYELIDDVRGLAEGLLAPTEREDFLGYAEIREVFNLSKIGNIAGCVVTEGLVRRGAEVRLLRDDVVMHRGKLAQLKRFKDDVNEVRSGTECGMAFESYGDLQAGDRIECFTVVEERRRLED